MWSCNFSAVKDRSRWRSICCDLWKNGSSIWIVHCCGGSIAGQTIAEIVDLNFVRSFNNNHILRNTCSTWFFGTDVDRRCRMYNKTICTLTSISKAQGFAIKINIFSCKSPVARQSVSHSFGPSYTQLHWSSLLQRFTFQVVHYIAIQSARWAAIISICGHWETEKCFVESQFVGTIIVN